MDWALAQRILPVLLNAAVQTLLIGFWTLLLSTVLALPLALLSFSSRRVTRFCIGAYSWVARGTPELVLLFFAFYALAQAGLRLEPMPAAIAGFTASATAYTLEIFRGGFMGVNRGQFEAARALGLPYLHTIRRIILPQVIRIIAPPYITNATAVVKHTSLASAIAVSEVTATANRLIVSTYRPFEILLVAALIYCALNSALVALQTVAERRWSLKA